MEGFTCTECKEEKPPSEFNKAKSSFGYARICKVCTNERRKARNQVVKNLNRLCSTELCGNLIIDLKLDLCGRCRLRKERNQPERVFHPILINDDLAWITLINHETKVAVDLDTISLIKDYEWRYCDYKNLIVSGSRNLRRILMDPPKGMYVRSINGNIFDCRRSNLKICDKKEYSRFYQIPSNNKTGVKGVAQEKGGTFTAYLGHNGFKYSATGIKSFEEAVYIRSELENQCWNRESGKY